MISVTVNRTDGEIRGFRIEGHALFDDPGKDIICAAVSILTINTINAVETFLPGDACEVAHDKENGRIEFRFKGRPSEGGKLLLDTYLLGILGIEKQYGRKYLKCTEQVLT